MEEREIIARNITYLRKKHGLSQLELAEKIQYSNKNISKWEKAETTPSVFTLKRLAEIFGITVDELVSTLQEEKDKEGLSEETDDTEPDDRKDSKVKMVLGLPISIKVLYLLMTEAIILVMAFIAIVVLGFADVTSFNKWLLLLYILPAMSLAVFIFIICVKKRVDIISLSLFGWLLSLCFFVTFRSAKNVHLIFLLMATIQFLIICIMLIINFNIIRRIKNKFTKK